MEKLKISLPIVVEGKYDKIKLSTIVDGTVFSVGGFALFNRKDMQALLRRAAERTGVLVLTDSDGGGRQLRSFLAESLPPGRVYHLYIPQVPGKEKRKRTVGRAGLLGVEGTDPAVLRALLAPYADGGERPLSAGLTKADFYADGFSGGEGSARRRAALAAALSLPTDLSADALLAAVNFLLTREEYCAAAARVAAEEGKEQEKNP